MQESLSSQSPSCPGTELQLLKSNLLQKLIVVPIAILVLAEIEEAHAGRAIERRAAVPLTKRIGGFKLRGRHWEAGAAQLTLRPGEVAAAAV